MLLRLFRFFSCTFLFFPLFAANLGPSPPTICSSVERLKQMPVTDWIEGISVVDRRHEEDNVPQNETIVLTDYDLPGGKKELEKLLEPFLDQPLSVATKMTILETVQCYLTGTRLSVQLLQMGVPRGHIRLLLSSDKIGRVEYEGNEHFKNWALNALGVHPGDDLTEEVLMEAVAWANRNPFLQLDACLIPEESWTDVVVTAKNRFLLRPFAGADNTGISPLSNYREYAGVTWGNAFDLGDLLTYQFTTSFPPKRFLSHTGEYKIFLPRPMELDLYGAYSSMHPHFYNRTQSGRFVQTSGRFHTTFGSIHQGTAGEFYLGIDYKSYDTNLFFFDTSAPAFSAPVGLLQLQAGFSIDVQKQSDVVRLSLEAWGAKSHAVPHETSTAYTRMRPLARPSYVYAKGSFRWSHLTWDNHQISLLVRGQYSPHPLVPSEQFSLGGYDTVRGYDEQQYTADNAVCANFELQLSLLDHFKKQTDGVRTSQAALMLLGFIDYGWGRNARHIAGETFTDQLLSVGPGLRFYMQRHLALRADYAFQIFHLRQGSIRDGKFHFGVNLAY